MVVGRALFVCLAGVSASMPPDTGSQYGSGGLAITGVDEYGEDEASWAGDDDFWNGDGWGPTQPDTPPPVVVTASSTPKPRTTSAPPASSAFRQSSSSGVASTAEDRKLVSDIEFLVGAFGIVAILLLAARVIFLQKQVGALNVQLAKQPALHLEDGAHQVEDFFPVKQAQAAPIFCELPVASFSAPMKEDLGASMPYVAKRCGVEDDCEAPASLEECERSDVDDCKSEGSSRKKKVKGAKRAVSPRRNSDSSVTKKVRSSEASSTKRARSPSKAPRKLKSKASN